MKISEIMLIAASTALAGAALAEPVGNVGAVNQSAEGAPPGGGARTLSIGAGVEARERITTNDKGSAQLVFRDKSTMTVGHASSVTINKFVYNAGEGLGAQSATLTKGALRFVGGAVSHTQGAKIETSSGSLTVRGGMAYACLNCSEGRIFAALAGEVTLSHGTSTVTIPPGEMVTVRSDGTISESTRIPPDILLALDKRFASTGHQRGGAKNPPTENDANTQLGDARIPDWIPWPGLAEVAVPWAVNAIVESKAQSDNQQSANTVRVLTTPPPPPQTESFSLIPSLPPGGR